MTAVFVHGVPETAGVWDPLKDHLAGEIVTLSLPGFGTPLPDGFEPTKESYAEWLTGELASSGSAVGGQTIGRFRGCELG